MTVQKETGRVATSAISALKDNPLCLSLVLLIAIITAVNYFETSKQMANRSQIINEVMLRYLPPVKR